MWLSCLKWMDFSFCACKPGFVKSSHISPSSIPHKPLRVMYKHRMIGHSRRPQKLSGADNIMLYISYFRTQVTNWGAETPCAGFLAEGCRISVSYSYSWKVPMVYNLGFLCRCFDQEESSFSNPHSSYALPVQFTMRFMICFITMMTPATSMHMAGTLSVPLHCISSKHK